MDIILEKEKKHGRAMLIEQIDEDEFKLDYVHLYNQPHKKFLGFSKENLKSEKEAYNWMIQTLSE